jgi:hypothetical protein
LPEGRKLLPFGNFYSGEPTSRFANAAIFHSDENSARESEARLDSAQLFVNEVYPAIGVGRKDSVPL